LIEPFLDEINTQQIDITLCSRLDKDNKTFLISCFDLNMTRRMEAFNNETFKYSQSYLLFPGTTKVIKILIK